MHNWFLVVENPYHFVVGEDGNYTIDQIPPGKYNVIAWHPMMGISEKEVDIQGSTTLNFELEAK